MRMGIRLPAQLSLAVSLAVTLACSSGPGPQSTVEIDPDDIGGVVTGANGPEAGVWVIAETADFNTRFARIVVTDDQGRYVVPDLPDANYEVWVRGYGLADSAKVQARPGQATNLTAIAAPTPAVAAQVYPAISWYSMMKIPPVSELPASLKGDRNHYLNDMKNNGCIGCHQLGQLSTRTIPKELGLFDSSEEAWLRRVQSGQAGDGMAARAQALGAIKYLAEWTDRIAKGEVPEQPPRPTGLERNIVVTVRDWSSPEAYMHDLSTTDRRNPTVNPYGPIYGAPESSTDDFPILDPVKNVATTFTAPVRDPATPSAAERKPFKPSPYWGDEVIWDSQANAHNPMLDHLGRVWYTASIRGPENPAFCREGSAHPSARLTPKSTTRSRHLTVYDPTTKEYTFVDTCFATHHLQFAEDENHTLWTSGGRDVVGWLNTEMLDGTGDAAKSQGWTALVLDTNGNGKRDRFVEPGQPANPTLDTRYVGGFYAVMPNPADGSVWGSIQGYPGAIVRLDPGANPPATALAEVYSVPLPGYGIRGADIDRHGVVWASLASGHLGEFDRRKCKGALNGPKATGDHCPEGWTFHRFPGPSFESVPEESVESSYYTWVDQRNTSNLGDNTPVATANLYDGLHALVNGEFVTMRVPYPMGFYAKGLEGRIDDPKAGWKGRGLWSTSGDRTPWLMEGGKGTKPLVVHFQVRDNPLAK